MTLWNYLGYAMIATPFVLIFLLAAVLLSSFPIAIDIFAGVAFLLVWICVGVWLANQ